MRRALAMGFAALALAGCALRARYGEFVGPSTQGTEVRLKVVERSSGEPVVGATVELGELRMKRVTRTDARGMFALPVDRRYLDDNSIISVNAPPGVGQTQVVAAPLPLAEPATQAPVELDAGSPEP